MKDSFDRAFAKIVSIEGGFIDDPKDPGGATKFGISQRAYPQENIASLTLDRAKEIYRRDYWDKVLGDCIPDPLSCFVFDAAVNHGVKQSIIMLQNALKITADGIAGQVTINAVKNSNKDVCVRFMTNRAIRYFQTNNFERFGNGWLNRLFILSINTE